MAMSQGLVGNDVAAIARTREEWLAALNNNRVDGLLKPLTDAAGPSHLDAEPHAM